MTPARDPLLATDLRDKTERDLVDALEARTGSRAEAFFTLDVVVLRFLADPTPDAAYRLGTDAAAVRWAEGATEAHRQASLS